MIQANGGTFWFGKSASTYCPSDVADIDCSDYSNGQTNFIGGNETVSLNVAVPGGQQVYIAPDGALSYTSPHSAFKPEGSVTTGFRKGSGTGFPDAVAFWYEGGKFIACPRTGDDGEEIYQIFVQTANMTSPATCITFALRTYDVGIVAAWEYS
ncbi:hypothetical protein GQ53DRAFT_821270 [Thozetella sp. PMI_491]|nr:hypothetical protein GQ53DRAFT_821270 [Thozetella sp. PMI_491]